MVLNNLFVVVHERKFIGKTIIDDFHVKKSWPP